MSLITNLIKYGWKKGVNLTIDQWNYGCRIITSKFIQRTVKENLLLLEDLIEP